MGKPNYNVDDDDDPAKFNEAAFIMRRLNNLQDRMNMLRSNLLSYNEELNDYNYRIFFNDSTSLMHEVWSKLTPKEKEECELMCTVLEESFVNTPPHKKINKLGKTVTIFDKNKWKNIKNVLFAFERKVKTFIEVHGMGNPNADDRGL